MSARGKILRRGDASPELEQCGDNPSFVITRDLLGPMQNFENLKYIPRKLIERFPLASTDFFKKVLSKTSTFF